ncbi:bile acid:sodium symporter [Candidatus Uhrbacteria bacterium]|nr:bile acid:sodium symporter [Candidatus Uhrbacteria bacterium]
MTAIERLKHFASDNQIMIVLLAIVVGVIFPQRLAPLNAYSTLLLMLIFFVSSLRLDLGELTSYVKDWKMLSVSNLIMLVLMPLAMWLPCWVFAPDWALAFLIVGAAPTGLTIALVADLFGGRQSLAMLIAVTTSLLAPLTMPFVLWLVVGQTVEFPIFSMFSSLLLTMVVPFIAAMLIKSRARKFIEHHDVVWREISLLIFGVLVAGITAASLIGSDYTFNPHDLGIVIVMTAFMGGVAWFGYATTYWRNPAERVTIALCLVYMNNTVALYIGDKYFAETNVVPKLIIILGAVNLLLPPLKWIATKVIKKETNNNTNRRLKRRPVRRAGVERSF